MPRCSVHAVYRLQSSADMQRCDEQHSFQHVHQLCSVAVLTHGRSYDAVVFAVAVGAGAAEVLGPAASTSMAVA